jgi:predicted dehydrogenase
MNRRTLLSKSAALAAGSALPSFAIGKPGKPANGKLNVAFIGSGGWIAQQPYNQGCSEENLVAFCDVDQNQCAENLKAWRTSQPFFTDFRVMLDKMHQEIDAVVISTPDHTHFPATLAAMERGIHVYTQKPITHNIWQARTLVKARERYKVITQMGNQGHAGDGIRKSVEAVRAGVIGDVAQVFCHNGGPQMGGPHFANPAVMPPPSSPVPAGLDWDLWLGPVSKRDYCSDYLPQKWRAFYEFGSGMLGDWGCHTLDTPVWALDLDAPTLVECLDRKESLEGVSGSTGRRIGTRWGGSRNMAWSMPRSLAVPAGWSARRGCSAAALMQASRPSFPTNCARHGRTIRHRRASRVSLAGHSASGCGRSKAKARSPVPTSPTPRSSRRSSC